ncbi:imidazole glycerol phosphate synthase subunit HisH [Pacificimonas flava]|uniref:Imidazole glycerol phosphate synthase subunit HisH n=2 Tax=Pacificimonas TaxID=1960290 RepID=A0A219B4A5_9SPHN|nr:MULTISPECIES: imidazole glycerol phosphate synthase subunit HisH [Pacificimonas]MBZ6377681.1 imidazole glycerol phosphate synthase subunit HisH [Pacificimonas aurantium]OWV32639.1 imidazole glycerol phosphate synthase subunit HisH [Pacificimonas flava]
MAQRIAVIDYGAGNLRSVAKGLETAACDAATATNVHVTAAPEDVAAADRIVLPGVGAFGHCAAALKSVPGMTEALTHAVLEKDRPFLGICVGMQLLADRGLERGAHAGLGWISGEVAHLEPRDRALKIPHMGWSPILHTDAGRAHPLVGALHDGGEAYFVHSYAFAAARPDHVLATCDYGGDVTAIIGRDNILGTQFHPEKSQAYGLRFLRAFLDWTL